MSTFNFHGEISGPGNFGDGGKIEIHHHGATAAEALRLATELAGRLRADGLPVLAEQADVVRGELVRAGQEQRPADPGRVRRALETISMALTTGSAGLALAQELGRVIGM